jgi:hypothetical protein
MALVFKNNKWSHATRGQLCAFSHRDGRAGWRINKTFLYQGAVADTFVCKNSETYKIKPALVVKINETWTYASPMQAAAYIQMFATTISRGNGGWKAFSGGQSIVDKSYVSRNGNEYEIAKYDARLHFDTFEPQPVHNASPITAKSWTTGRADAFCTLYRATYNIPKSDKLLVAVKRYLTAPDKLTDADLTNVAIFGEEAFADRGLSTTGFWRGTDDVRFANTNSDNYKRERDLALELFEEAEQKLKAAARPSFTDRAVEYYQKLRDFSRHFGPTLDTGNESE